MKKNNKKEDAVKQNKLTEYNIRIVRVVENEVLVPAESEEEAIAIADYMVEHSTLNEVILQSEHKEITKIMPEDTKVQVISKKASVLDKVKKKLKK